MKVQEIGTRGLLFTFDDPYKTNLYAMNGEKFLFICDTFLGPDSMNEVIVELKKKGFFPKPVIVFNSHHDYDHIWGNQCFKDSIIIAHELCLEKIEMIGKKDLDYYKDHMKGNVQLTLPNVIFKDRVFFEEEGVEFYHTPGHTEDSSSCFDHIDEVLFVGDNLETPLPYIRILDISEYITTLEEYLAREPMIILSGHDDVMFTDEVLKENLNYLKEFQEGAVNREKFTQKHNGIHFMNLQQIGELLKERGDMMGALSYYEEALVVLEEFESNSQIEKKIENIKEIIEELKK